MLLDLMFFMLLMVIILIAVSYLVEIPR